MTFNASSSATIGTSLVTITGISGSTTASTSISLTVNTSSGQSICSPTGVMALDGGAYEFQMNEYDSTLQECATVSGTGFTITTANFNNATNGSPATYTSIYSGCHWGLCTSSNPFPIEENSIASATSSVSITQPSGYTDDASYDIWFNQTSTTTGQPNGTEIMVWLNHQGSVQPFGTNTGNVTIDGASWAVWTGNQTSWKIVSYVANTPVTSATNLNLLPFFSDAVSRGSLQPTWWLIDVEYGFEIWTGGQGSCDEQLQRDRDFGRRLIRQLYACSFGSIAVDCPRGQRNRHHHSDGCKSIRRERSICRIRPADWSNFRLQPGFIDELERGHLHGGQYNCRWKLSGHHHRNLRNANSGDYFH